MFVQEFVNEGDFVGEILSLEHVVSYDTNLTRLVETIVNINSLSVVPGLKLNHGCNNYPQYCP